ncbi:ABC transporter ATP-binding protein [Reyranella sp.]|uniref:ABC transporter ATP-binding protein n=1 Tax=Reyranella sp. TaxID=1929291 RepID=UPI003D0C2B33
MILEVDGLQIHYRTAGGTVRAVDGASFAIPEGRIVGLVGESGCGKTTAVRAIMGVLAENGRRAGGRVTFKGRPIDETTTRPLLWRDIAYVPQSAMSSLDPVYTVGAQIVEVLTRRGRHARAAARARAAELFDLVGLSESRLGDYPHQFSGGMRQRAAIAMALALEPSLLLADEPVTALDVIVQRQILDTLRALQQRLKLSMVLVTHDISVVAYLCDEVVVMYAGQVIESGPVREVLGRPRHPYTMGLRNAFPDLMSDALELVPIAGSPPDLADPPPGCRFTPRCPFALATCSSQPAAIGSERGSSGRGGSERGTSESDSSERGTFGSGTSDKGGSDKGAAGRDQAHVSACLRDGEADHLRTSALDPVTWQRSSAYATS